MKSVLLPLIFLALQGCFANEALEITDDYSHIENPKERWAAYKMNDYSISQTRICECLPPYEWVNKVNGNSVIDVEFEMPQQMSQSKEDIKEGLLRYSAITVDEAFQLIEEYQGKADSIKVSYDERFGYPSSIFIDLSREVADEEIIYSFYDLKKN